MTLRDEAGALISQGRAPADALRRVSVASAVALNASAVALNASVGAGTTPPGSPVFCVDLEQHDLERNLDELRLEGPLRRISEAAT